MDRPANDHNGVTRVLDEYEAMTIYKPQRSPYYHYDFVVRGERFHGSTGCDDLAAALACEQRLRERRAAIGDCGKRLPSEMNTLDSAIDAIRFAAKQDLQRGAGQRASELLDAASLMEAMGDWIKDNYRD